MLKKTKNLFYDIISIWDNINGCTDQYRYAIALYLLSLLDHAYNIIIGCGIVSLGRDQDIVSGLNATDKPFISMLMSNVQFPGSKGYDNQTAI